MTKRLSIILFSVLVLTSCIKNDLPKPVVDLFIASLDVEGASGEVVLDRATYTATIPLKEETDIYNVKIKSITYGADVVTNVNYEADTSKIVVSKDLNGKEIDLSNPDYPEYITLSYYQSYEWKIVATQNINRIWTVDGQIGATEWDLEGHRAIVKRRSDKNLKNVKTTDMRFGPRPTYDYPEITDMPTDFDNADKSRTITVAAHNHSTIWKLIIVPTLAEPEFIHIVGGANVIWIKANAIDGSEIIFKYREVGQTEWITTNPEWYAKDLHNPYNRYEQGYVKAILRGLKQNTTYEIQGWANTTMEDGSTTEIPSKTFTVTTTASYQMPNSDMEQWSQLNNDKSFQPTEEPGACWYPFSSLQEMFWGTGNPGGTMLGPEFNLTYPVYKKDSADNVPSDSTGETSAYMGSRYVVMKYAAGNLFVGHFGNIIGGTNAEVFFGRPISQNIRPVALRFKVKYTRGGIDRINSAPATSGTEYHIGSKQIKIVGGQPDVTKVFFCLTDWAEPHCVNSADEKTFFDPRTAAGILGLGYFDSDNNPELIVEHTERWHTMTIPIEYSDPEATATHLVLTFTCSGYGDYFTGSEASNMSVDDIELLYDLDDENQPK